MQTNGVLGKNKSTDNTGKPYSCRKEIILVCWDSGLSGVLFELTQSCHLILTERLLPELDAGNFDIVVLAVIVAEEIYALLVETPTVVVRVFGCAYILTINIGRDDAVALAPEWVMFTLAPASNTGAGKPSRKGLLRGLIY